MENKFREFYIDSEGESNITMNVCRGVMSYNFKNAIHVIEIAAVEQLKDKNLELSNMYKQQIEKNYSLRVDKDAEIEQLKAEKESYYHDYRMKFDIETKQLHTDVAALKSKLKIAVEALVLLESFGYITQFKYIKQALTEIGGEI